MKRAGLTVVLLCAGLFCCGCLSGNAVRALEATPEEARSYYDASGAAVQGLPFDSRNYLQTHLLMETFQDSPELLISRLKKELDEEQSPFLLNVLADVCYSLAQQEESDASGPYFLSAAFCYYRLLFDPSVRRVSRSRFDPAALRAVMRYNVASGMVFQYLQRHNLLDRSSFSLPLADGGQIFFAEPARLDGPLPRERIRAFYLCANYRTENLQHFSCEFGIGVPLFAKALPLKSGADGLKFPDGIALPMTGLLRFTRRGNAIRARFELYDALKTGSVTIEEESVPLMRDFSTPAACFLNTRTGVSELFNTLHPDRDSAGGLYATAPYDPDKIPLVFVHGLMSSPRTWIQLVNTLMNDPEIRSRYQFWFYAYSSGNPVLASAGELRRALDRTAREYGENANFRKMVVVGHSMGGLLSKTLIMDSGNTLLDRTLGRPWNEAKQELDSSDVRTLEELAVLKRREYVARVVFMAVPHRGSEMADWGIARFAASLVTLPVRMVEGVQRIAAKLLPGNSSLEQARKLYTGFDNLSPENPVLKLLAETPLSPDVPCNSIVGNREESGVPGGSDGVVSYESAHLDGVESERIVKSGHSVQENAETARELVRILRLHLNRSAKKSLPGT